MQYTDKNNDTFTVRSAELSDFDTVKKFCEDRFGEGYLTKEEFEKWVKDADFCKVADYDGTPVGIVYLMPEEPEKVAKYMKLSEEYVKSVSFGTKVIHSRCAALDKEYEGRGIMPIVHEEIYANIQNHGYKTVFAPAWTYNGYTPMNNILVNFGFEFIGEKEDIWYGMDGYKCIICNGPCRCKAAIYKKTF